jgi:DNA-directed RNA polymerase subunit RPC12/RpoP
MATNQTTAATYRCPNCNDVLALTGGTVRCDECGHTPRHGAD